MGLGVFLWLLISGLITASCCVAVIYSLTVLAEEVDKHLVSTTKEDSYLIEGMEEVERFLAPHTTDDNGQSLCHGNGRCIRERIAHTRMSCVGTPR